MRQSNKSRSRNKNNNNRRSNNNNSGGNVVNRVFDSAGPEGRVRGTPQQIIEKYQGLARDATLADDRVAAENFNQHAEHYTRILAVAQAEQAERQAEHAARQAEQAARQAEQNAQRQKQQAEAAAKAEVANAQPDVTDAFEANSGEQDTLVPTPETAPRPRSRSRRKPAETPQENTTDAPVSG